MPEVVGDLEIIRVEQVVHEDEEMVHEAPQHQHEMVQIDYDEVVDESVMLPIHETMYQGSDETE